MEVVMKQEDKELFKYLCMALPYEVLCRQNAVSVDGEPFTIVRHVSIIQLEKCLSLDDVEVPFKPYLRSMSSMTKKEMEEYNGEFEKDRQDILKVGKEFEEVFKNKKYESVWQHPVVPMHRHIIWLLRNHFDFMGLIPKGLAIEVTEDNNPYKN